MQIGVRNPVATEDQMTHGFHNGTYYKTLRFEGEIVHDGTNMTLQMRFLQDGAVEITPAVHITGASGQFVDTAQAPMAFFHAHPDLWEALLDAYRHRTKGGGGYVIADPIARKAQAERDPEGVASEAPSTLRITECPRCDGQTGRLPDEVVHVAKYEVSGQPIDVVWHRTCWNFAAPRERTL
jgi:hypothetical protein